uniref:Disease resistance protein RGA1 n=1 Tax=Cicer arietinum TaxID=3827 RepID=A0A3Q7XMW3_CICAR|nr:putative disease resistance protein RGA1 [Cicer arietinum]
MAEKFVFDIAESLLKKLTSYAYQEVSRAYGVYEDLQRIKDTLTIVKCLLLDAEEKKNQQYALHEWQRQIQYICSDAEYVLEEFELQDKRKQVVKASRSTSMKIQTLRMRNLHLENFLELLTFPRWIEDTTDTLETLIVVNCPNLKNLPKCLITMSRLKRLYIRECPLLRRILLPSDMHHLTALEDLQIYDCPELYKNYQPQCGKYWPMIAHIKSVSIEEPSGEEE